MLIANIFSEMAIDFGEMNIRWNAKRPFGEVSIRRNGFDEMSFGEMAFGGMYRNR
jgi:hypothetical protein